MNSHRTEGRGSPLLFCHRGKREQRPAEKEAEGSSQNWPFLVLPTPPSRTRLGRFIGYWLMKSLQTLLDVHCGEGNYIYRGQLLHKVLHDRERDGKK